MFYVTYRKLVAAYLTVPVYHQENNTHTHIVQNHYQTLVKY